MNDKEEELAPIDYKDLPTQTLTILKEIINSGRTIYMGVNTLPDRVPVSFDDVEEILKEREEDKTSEDEEEEEDEDLTTNNKDADEGDDSEEDAPDEEETEETTKSSTTKKKTTTFKTTSTSSASTATTPSTSDAATPDACTVSFMYNSGTFAEQYVTYGMAASKPKLQPSASGNWYYTTEDGSLAVFDFSTPIMGNIILTWQ